MPNIWMYRVLILGCWSFLLTVFLTVLSSCECSDSVFKIGNICLLSKILPHHYSQNGHKITQDFSDSQLCQYGLYVQVQTSVTDHGDRDRLQKVGNTFHTDKTAHQRRLHHILWLWNFKMLHNSRINQYISLTNSDFRHQSQLF